MALSKEVTKLFPSPNKIGMRLVLADTDEGCSGFTKDYWQQFSPGDGATTAIKQKIGRDMQRDIDRYKALKTVYEADAFDTAVTQISNALEI